MNATGKCRLNVQLTRYSALFIVCNVAHCLVTLIDESTAKRNQAEKDKNQQLESFFEGKEAVSGEIARCHVPEDEIIAM